MVSTRSGRHTASIPSKRKNKSSSSETNPAKSQKTVICQDNPAEEKDSKIKISSSSATSEKILESSEVTQNGNDLHVHTIIEEGIIYFFFRPKVGLDQVESFADIQRTYLILKPKSVNVVRILSVPRKKVFDTPSNKFVGIVGDVGEENIVADDLGRQTYETAKSGHRVQGAARPFAEGVYALVHEEKSTHLAYKLTYPQEMTDTEKEFGLIKDTGSFNVSVRNPLRETTHGAPEDKAKYPEELQSKFSGKAWTPITDARFLDYKGGVVLFIGERHDEQLDRELDEMAVEEEHRVKLSGADVIYSDLGIKKDEFQNEMK